MFTRAEKGYLALTLFFLMAGSGIKAYRHSLVRLGPFPASAHAPTPDSGSGAADSLIPRSAGSAPDSGSQPFDSVEPASNPGAADSAGGNGMAAALERGGPGRSTTAPAHGGATARKPDFAGKVDLNRADAAALTRVKGIGEKTALAILEYRKAHGPFRELRELLHVKGIGEKKLEKLSPFLIL